MPVGQRALSSGWVITEKASSEAFLPIASIKKTALKDPNKAPTARRLPMIKTWCH